MIITIEIEIEDITYILDALEHRASRYAADSNRCLTNGYGNTKSFNKSRTLKFKSDHCKDIYERIREQTYDYEM